MPNVPQVMSDNFGGTKIVRQTQIALLQLSATLLSHPFLSMSSFAIRGVTFLSPQLQDPKPPTLHQVV